MEKIHLGPGTGRRPGEFDKRSRTPLLEHGKEYKRFENTSTYLPRICNPLHQPACVASLPLRRHVQARRRTASCWRPGPCRGWRMCIPARTRRCSTDGVKRKVHRLLSARQESACRRFARSPVSAASATTASCRTTPTSSTPPGAERAGSHHLAHLTSSWTLNDPAIIEQARIGTVCPTTGWKLRTKSPSTRWRWNRKIAFPRCT